MKKVYMLEELDCAHCAAIIETEVKKIKGVIESNCGLLTQKLTLTIEDNMDEIFLLNEIKRIVGKVESEVVVEEIE